MRCLTVSHFFVSYFKYKKNLPELADFLRNSAIRLKEQYCPHNRQPTPTEYTRLSRGNR